MARTVADLALFLDTMAGLCPHDPMTFDAPHVSFSDAVAQPVAPKRVAFTADYNGKMAIDRELRDICTQAARRFEELGCIVEEASPDIGPSTRRSSTCAARPSSSSASCSSRNIATS